MMQVPLPQHRGSSFIRYSLKVIQAILRPLTMPLTRLGVVDVTVEPSEEDDHSHDAYAEFAAGEINAVRCCEILKAY